MEKNEIKWLETEYCGNASQTVQPCIIDNTTIVYVLFAKGYNYVFDTIYQLHLYWNGVDGQYKYTCETEEQLEEYLENIK